MPLIFAHESIENTNWGEFKEQICANSTNGVATTAYIVTNEFEVAEVINVRFGSSNDRYILFDTNDCQKQVEHCCAFFQQKKMQLSKHYAIGR